MYNTIYPVNIKPYVPPQKKPAAANGEETSQTSDLQRGNRGLEEYQKRDKNNYQTPQYPNGKKASIDYSKSRVNIAQIINDFKNTAQAIGTPDYIVEEVDQYLAMAQTQSLKDEPNKKLIQTNLKNASSILDDFISKTLNKNSKVVENWIDALFLQQVDYKFDENVINPDFLVKLPGKDNSKALAIAEKNAEKSTQENAPAAAEQLPAQTTTEPSKSKTIYIPENPEIKKAFIQGKRLATANESQKALAAFGFALNIAQNTNDKQAQSMVCFEIGQIHDKNDNLEQALQYYHQSLETASDNNLKAKAYYSMAEIYNDIVYFEPAMNHYYAAISFAGQAENLNAQTKALGNIAQMYAERYDKNNAIEYFHIAKGIAAETKNNKTLGAIYSKSGDTMKMLEENVNALNDYKESSRYYEMAESPVKMAKNYEKAAYVMSKLGNSAKAKSLMQKAYNIALSANSDYAEIIAAELTKI